MFDGKQSVSSHKDLVPQVGSADSVGNKTLLLGLAKSGIEEIELGIKYEHFKVEEAGPE